MKYCTYLTTYRGNKLPPFYIGSSTVDRIASGYNGSVQSKMYGRTWRRERTLNPHLFVTRILSTHTTREESIAREAQLHRHFNVHSNSMYCNRAVASLTGKGFVHTSGKDSPAFGKKWSAERRAKLSASKRGKPHNRSDVLKEKLRAAHVGKKLSPHHIERLRDINTGRQISDEQKAAIRLSNSIRVISDETRRKISIARTGQKQSPDTIRARVEKTRGRTRSDATRERMRLAWVERKLRMSREEPVKAS